MQLPISRVPVVLEVGMDAACAKCFDIGVISSLCAKNINIRLELEAHIENEVRLGATERIVAGFDYRPVQSQTIQKETQYFQIQLR
jgi:hypothetical protein